jgi:hypothetical protein
MAAVATVADTVAPVFPAACEIFDGIAGVDLTAGELVYWNSGGKLVKTNAGAAGTAKCAGMVLGTVKAGQAVSILKEGHVGGVTVAGLAYGAKVYASNTAGALDDGAGTVSVQVGTVVPMTDLPTLSKVLFFSANWAAL